MMTLKNFLEVADTSKYVIVKDLLENVIDARGAYMTIPAHYDRYYSCEVMKIETDNNSNFVVYIIA